MGEGPFFRQLLCQIRGTPAPVSNSVSVFASYREFDFASRLKV